MDKLRTRILVVDDEPKYIYAIKFNLESSGYEVLTAGDGEAAVALAANEEPALILLDIRMPGIDGFLACQRIREFSTVPIIMLTAASAEVDKVKGLDAGADDYITKPFGADELMSRVRAALRRVEMSAQPKLQPDFQAGDLRINFIQQRVFLNDQEVELTPTEYRLLYELVKRAERVLVPEFLLKEVWGSGYEREIPMLWQAIHRLRRKIEPDTRNPRYIQTRPGVGYVFTKGEE